MVLPPLAHPLPPRPGTYQPSSSSSNRVPPPPIQATSTSTLPPSTPSSGGGNPLSLPNRPPISSSLPTRPSLNNSSSSASTPSSFYGTSGTATGTAGGGGSPKVSTPNQSKESPANASTTTTTGLGLGELPWPKVRGKLTPLEAKTNSELIELGQGWEVHYKCWKGDAIPLSSSSTSSDSTSSYDPFIPSTTSNPAPPHPASSTTATTSSASPSKLKAEEPPKKKSRPTLPTSDSLAVVEDLFPLPPLPPTPLPKYNQPTLRTDASTSKLRDQLKTLHSSTLGTEEDSFEKARRDLIRRGKEKVEEGGDRLDFIVFVKVASTQIESRKKEEVDAKGKGKEKESTKEETAKVEAAGRTLWAFSIVRGGDHESTKAVFDELNYAGLECIASGTFDHQSLYPALYPPSSTSTSGGSSPLTRSAHNYPSALALSANFLSSSSFRSTPLAIAHQTFLSAVEDTLMSELVTSSLSHSSCDSWQRIGNSIALLPPASAFTSTYDSAPSFNSNSTPTSPRKRSQPLATLSTFRATLQRSTIFVQTRLEEIPYRPFPSFPSSSTSSSSSVLPLGYPIMLAPLGLKARLVRRIQSDASSLEQLRVRWRNQLEGSNLEIEGRDWIVCRLDLSSSNSNSDEISTASYSSSEGEDGLVWPTELVLIDGTRPPPPPTPQSSPEKPVPTELSPNDHDASKPTNHLSVASPDAKFPPPQPSTTPDPHPLSTPRSRLNPLLPSPYDSSARRRLAAKALGRSNRRKRVTEDPEGESIKFVRDPLAQRTNEVWTWMEDETARIAREAEEKAAKELKEKEEEEERKRLEELEKEKKRSNLMMGKATPGASAPINMRTPMSLGTSSTEAPSPADIVYPPPHGYSTNSSGAQQNYLTTPTTTTVETRPGGEAMEIDGLGLGLYPSPEEPPQTTIATTTSQPMSSLDNAFASFDWGDGSYGTSNAGGGGGAQDANQDYDDGMDLLGLTDDDFSFFDTAPTPLPGTSLPPPSNDPFTMPLSTTTSPKFVDHFSHLSSSSTSAAHFTSPTSPFPTHTTSPQFAVQSSPLPTNSTQFPFDSSSNALGLAPGPSFPVPTQQPSPPSPNHEISLPSFAVELAPTESIQISPLRSRRPLPGAYDPIPFASSYEISTEKYDSRKGKFGLLTPDSEDHDESSDPNLSYDSILPRPTAGSLEPWYKGICDPRRAVAERLQRDRRSRSTKQSSGRGRGSRGRGRSTSRGGESMKMRGWKRAISREGEGSDGTTTADEESGEESEMEIEEVENERTRKDVNEEAEAEEESRKLLESGGVELLAFGEFVNSLLRRSTSIKSVPTPVSPATLPSLELLLILLVEQNLVNPDSRSLFKTPRTDNVPRLLSTYSIQDVSSSLATVCSNLSPSPLFADHTLLPPLESTVSSSLLIRSQQSMIQVSTAAVEFWKPMGFEPVIGRKDVTIFAVYEEAGSGPRESVDEWLRTIATTYQGLRLGEQTPGQIPASAQFGGTQDGHLALPAGTLARGLSKEDSKALSVALSDVSKTYQNVVIYIFTAESDTFSTSSPLFTLVHLLQRSRSPHASLIICPIPLSHFNKKEPFQGRTKAERFTSCAFSLFDQLQVPVSRLRFPIPDTFPSAAAAPNPANQGPSVRLYQAPAIKLSPVRPRRIGFDMNFPVSTLAVQQRHRFLHVCYSSSPANSDGTADWIHLASIDDTGEIWRTVNRLMKAAPGAAGDVLKARCVWQCVLQLLITVDVEWRIVICRLGEPSIVEIRAWDSMLKDQLTSSIRRPLHATFVYCDLNPPLSIQPSTEKPRRTSVQSDTISEEGELNLVSRPSKTDPLFDTEPTILSFTPSEPINVLPEVNLFAPASTYLIHVPRVPSFTHSTVDSSSPSSTGSPAPISVIGIHFLLSHASRSSSYTTSPLSDLVKDVRQSYAELGALAKVRSNMNGRLPWHLEAVRIAKEIAESISQQQPCSSTD
ncbi:uncharacterized protein JCM6883_007574 [Sporobolomyces salmoneus]|uniref:uncharacterized protein n=1 Tax=Sporobolomyces salmoneus TaxID=183962 RepID=UPI003179DB08